MQDRPSNSNPSPPSSSSSSSSSERPPPRRGSLTKEPARPKSRLMQRADVKHEAQQIGLRTRQLTFSLLTFVGAVSSLSPFLGLHLTNQIGFLLFESDLLQLRASLVTVMVCVLALVMLGVILIIVNKSCPPFQELNPKGGDGESSPDQRRVMRRRSLLLQKVLKRSAGTLATISILSYLSLALLVQNIHQTQRLPFATFDCNANLIIIENCQQQFPTAIGKSRPDHDFASILLDTVPQLFGGHPDGSKERLANRLECLKYNDESLYRLRAPTRFLLSNCGLVCRSHRQQLHQFGDDLNSDPTEVSYRMLNDSERPAASTRTVQLIAPYSQPDYQEVNASTRLAHNSGLRDSQDDNQDANHLVSLKLCFSGELDGTNSNYKRFCIENLTGAERLTQIAGSDLFPARQAHGSQLDKTLTVSQLNAILSKVKIERATSIDTQQLDSHEDSSQTVASSRSSSPVSVQLDQSTHYVNPIVQFESHFKNWPHLTRAGLSAGDQRSGSNFYGDKHFQATSARPHNDWCKFKPIPPLIVNNKPFSDIHCSLESDYLISTSSSHPTPVGQRYRRQPRATAPRIYLKKSVASSPNDNAESASGYHRDRCNIQCRVNILYQVLANSSSDGGSSQPNSYYLPMKYCLVVSSFDDKRRASWSYMIFRSLADASLLLAFILVDAQLLIESRDTKQFQLEGKKGRLIGLILALVVPPILAGLVFDQFGGLLQGSSQTDRDNHWLIKWCNEHLLPWLSSLWNRFGVRYNPQEALKAQTLSNASEFMDQTSSRMKQEFVVDKYLVPFVVYAVLMFAFALSTFKMPLVFFVSPLVGMASTEELGLAKSSHEQLQSTGKRAKSPTKDAPRRPGNLKAKVSSLRRSLSSVNSALSLKKDQTQMRQHLMEPRELVNFALLTLFLGLQYNLSQLTQSQILLDSFNIQNDLIVQQQAKVSDHKQANTKVATWLVLISSSGGAFAMLLIALVFSNELSHFLNEFYPFKQAPKVHDQSSRSHELATFNKFLAISSIIYSLRYFVLANITPQATRLKWPLVVLFQSTELLNFPLTWFVLTSRAHELLTDWKQHQSLRQPTGEVKTREGTRPDTPSSSGPPNSSMSLHLIIQATMAFIYFALARFLALFTHSLHASLYLHSDNIDWFIDHRHHSDWQTLGNRTASRSATSSLNDSLQSPIESQFVPLPSERQTYLHASRLFVKYNSLVCLVVGLLLGSLFAAHKCQVYLESRRLERAYKRGRTSPSDQDSGLIDERLSMDLAEIHSRPREEPQRRPDSTPNLTRHIPRPRHDHRMESTTDESGASGLARAQVHFRYGYGRTRRTSSSSSSSGSYSIDATRNLSDDRRRHQAQQSITTEHDEREAWRRVPQADSQFRHSQVKQLEPVVEDSRSSYQRRGEQRPPSGSSENESVEEEVKQISLRRSIRIVEDDEIWPDEEEEEEEAAAAAANGNSAQATDYMEYRRPHSISPGEAQRMLELSMAISPPPVEFADNYELYMPPPPEEFLEPESLRRFSSDGMQAINGSGGRSALTSALERQRRRQITFSPTTTFIDQDGGQSTRVQGGSESDQCVQAGGEVEDLQMARSASRVMSTSNRQRSKPVMASPEPSLDDDDEEEY